MRAQHKEGFVKLTELCDLNLYSPRHTKIQLSLEEKKCLFFPIQNTSHSLGPNLYFLS